MKCLLTLHSSHGGHKLIIMMMMIIIIINIIVIIWLLWWWLYVTGMVICHRMIYYILHRLSFVRRSMNNIEWCVLLLLQLLLLFVTSYLKVNFSHLF